jgi:hypothetical protein
MKKIELNEEHLKSLEAFLADMPFKYANPLFMFFGELNKAQNGQQTEVKEVEVEG